MPRPNSAAIPLPEADFRLPPDVVGSRQEIDPYDVYDRARVSSEAKRNFSLL
jgi:hypothetical protein